MDILIIILLIAAALALIILEVFFLPGITIAGIFSVLFYGAGIYYAYTSFGITGAWVTLLTAFIVTIIALIRFVRSRSFNRMALHTQVDSVVPSTIPNDIHVGDVGMTLSRLNPMGTIIIGSHTVEARAENELIDENTPVTVTHIESTVVIVTTTSEESN